MFAQVKDVRLVRDKNSGLSRCFAFVEFFTVEVSTFHYNNAYKINYSSKNKQTNN